MCLWLPNWPIQRRLVGRDRDERALIVYSGGGRGKPRVVACSRAARTQGVLPGMTLAEAQSLWSAAAARRVRFEEHDPTADQQALRDLARWCQQHLSPKVALDTSAVPDCLLLDATGCGEAAFAESATTMLERQYYRAAAVVAGTVGAAWALAHYGQAEGVRAVPAGGEKKALQPLPIEALRLPAAIVESLHQLRVMRIDQLLVLPRAQLPARFGIEILRQIDRALGSVPEIVAPEPLVEPLQASWEFESAVTDGRTISAALDYLLDWLLARIPTEHFGIQRLVCTLKLVDDEPLCFRVELLQPATSKRDLLELIELQMQRLRLVGEVSQITVQPAVIRPLEYRQDELFGGSHAGRWRHEVRGLLERLSSRLGDKAVLTPVLQPDAQPEYACRYEPSLLADLSRPLTVVNPPMATAPVRPAFLRADPSTVAGISLAVDGSPLQFEWNGHLYLVEQAWGPERIETGWWRGQDIRRDYFLVETTAGERFWMFRDLTAGEWYLHGIFA